MVPRGTVLAALVVIEVAIAGGVVIAVRGDDATPPAALVQRDAAGHLTSATLVEGGAERTFEARAEPALTVDIGNADLTIRTGGANQFSASISKAPGFGFFRAREPITASIDGGTMRIVATDRRESEKSDFRMVTVIVPPQTRVTVAGAGDLTMDGIRATASLTSRRGDITVEDYVAPALTVAAAHGSIALRQVAAPVLDVFSKEDDIDGSGLQSRNGRIASGDGRVALDFAAGTDTLVTATTKDGHVLVAGQAASNAGPASSSESDAASQAVTVGGGHGRLDVHTDDGNVTLTVPAADKPKS